MNRFALMVVLCLLTGMTQATFELEDPAAQMYQAQQAMQDRLVNQTPEENTLCMVDTDTNECFCIHAESEEKIPMTDNECKALATKVADIKKQLADPGT